MVSTLGRRPEHALLSTSHQIEKSRGFKSGDHGGQKFFSQHEPSPQLVLEEVPVGIGGVPRRAILWEKDGAPMTTSYSNATMYCTLIRGWGRSPCFFVCTVDQKAHFENKLSMEIKASMSMIESKENVLFLLFKRQSKQRSGGHK